MKIINLGPEDYHIHSINFSDGFNTIDEIVVYAGEIGLSRIAITDHNQVCLDRLGFKKETSRSITKRWENVHNNVKVSFGVEGDLLNEEGDICDHIQGMAPKLVILSAHPDIYQSPNDTITKGYINAIKRHPEKIHFIGHLCSKDFSGLVDINKVIKAANDYGVALEINGSGLMNRKTDMDNLRILLEKADRVYVNSDAHTLNALRDARKRVFDYLRKEGIKFD